jgi:hypothetical protein
MYPGLALTDASSAAFKMRCRLFTLNMCVASRNVLHVLVLLYSQKSLHLLKAREELQIRELVINGSLKRRGSGKF